MHKLRVEIFAHFHKNSVHRKYNACRTDTASKAQVFNVSSDDVKWFIREVLEKLKNILTIRKDNEFVV